jgi:hypothetical protein
MIGFTPWQYLDQITIGGNVNDHVPLNSYVARCITCITIPLFSGTLVSVTWCKLPAEYRSASVTPKFPILVYQLPHSYCSYASYDVRLVVRVASNFVDDVMKCNRLLIRFSIGIFLETNLFSIIACTK